MSDDALQAQRRALLAERFPQLGTIATFDRVGEGWTCATYEVDGDWIVQFPIGASAEASLRHQIAVLPEIAAEVSSAVPEPELVSLDPVFMGYRKLAGRSLVQAGNDGVWPERLGRFLYDLHMIPPEYLGLRARGAAAVREQRRGELAILLERVGPHLDPDERGTFAARFEEFLGVDDLWRFAPCVAHNDLAPEHILVGPTGDLVGVIDWEEAGIGDPAWDFAWLLGARPDAGERALAAYGGEPDAGFRERARFAFLLVPWHEAVHGLETGRASLVRSGLAAVRERAG